VHALDDHLRPPLGLRVPIKDTARTVVCSIARENEATFQLGSQYLDRVAIDIVFGAYATTPTTNGKASRSGGAQRVRNKLASRVFNHGTRNPELGKKPHSNAERKMPNPRLESGFGRQKRRKSKGAKAESSDSLFLRSNEFGSQESRTLNDVSVQLGAVCRCRSFFRVPSSAFRL
jgi:hypothetical protein